MKDEVFVPVLEFPPARKKRRVLQHPFCCIKSRPNQPGEEQIIDFSGGNVFGKKRIETVDVTLDSDNHWGGRSCRTVATLLRTTRNTNGQNENEDCTSPDAHPSISQEWTRLRQ